MPSTPGGDSVDDELSGTSTARTAIAIVGLFLVLLPLHGLRGTSAAVAQSAPGAMDGAAPAQAPAPADGEGSEPVEPMAVVPPGQEALLADMLGRGAELPGQCKFAGAQADRTLIRSRYACPGGEVVFELSHPSAAAPGATETAEFALALRGGTAPDGLVDALVARIRAREGDYEWKWVGGQRRRVSTWTILLAAVGLVGLMAAMRVLRRRQSRRTPSH